MKINYTDYFKRNKKNQFYDDSIHFEVKGITVHNTGTALTPSELIEKLKENGHTNSAHFLVGSKEIIQILPLTVNAFHTGKGYDIGNTSTIAIEICESTCSKEIYERAESNAIELIKTLLNKYDLPTNRIYFHNDFNKTTYCPHRILDSYTKKEWLERSF